MHYFNRKITIKPNLTNLQKSCKMPLVPHYKKEYTMGNIAIMTDTNSGIIPKFAADNDIFLMKMPFFVDGYQYLEYDNIKTEDFYKKLGEGADVSTSQPSPGALTNMWDKILKTYDSLVYLPMSSGLSGTYSTAFALAADYEGKVFVVNNRRISVTLYESVTDALRLRDYGMSAAEIAETLEKEGSNSSIYVAVNTLQYLKKSGRVTPAGAAIGSLLGIKPVLTIQGGKLDAYKKVRGMSSAMEAMLAGIENDIKTRFPYMDVHIRAAYSGDISVGRQWQKAVKEHFKDYEIGLDALPISIACHVGAGALGIGVAKTL